MSSANYKWLIVGEGEFDFNTYTSLLIKFGVSGFLVKYVKGKGNVVKMNSWKKLPVTDSRIATQSALRNDQGRDGFRGVILVVDADKKTNLPQNYAGYSQECRSPLLNYADWQSPQEIKGTSIMLLDAIKGTNSRMLPIYGLCVPVSGQGCLETDLLRAYGYPVENESSYSNFATTIEEASHSWGVEKSHDGKEWWDLERNGKARMDKFMYAALKEGFDVNRLTTKLIKEPQIITDIKTAMDFTYPLSGIKE